MLAMASRKIYWTMGKTSATNRKSTSLGRSIYYIYIYIPTFVTIYFLICSKCFLGASANPRNVEAFARTWFLLLGTTKGDRYVILGQALEWSWNFGGCIISGKTVSKLYINTARGYKTCGEPQIKDCWHQLWTIGLGSCSSCLLLFDRALFMPHSISSTFSENGMKDKKNRLTSLWPMKSVPRIW